MIQYTQNGNGLIATDHNTNHLRDNHHHQQHDNPTHPTWARLEKDDHGERQSSISIHIPQARYFAPLIMFIGFLLSITLAMIFRFKETTYTHCRVPNYIPSISAAIGTTPSSYFWRLSLCLSSLPRLLFVAFRYRFYLDVPTRISSWYRVLCHLCFLCELVENVSLIGLSCISSNDNGDIHEALFISFQVSSMLHMILMCRVYRLFTSYNKNGLGSTTILQDDVSLRRKRIITVLNVASFFISLYFYFRHQRRCEAGMYSMFALCEYFVVITNILFHAGVYLDFPNKYIVYGGRIHTD